MYTGCSYKRPFVPANDRLFTGRIFWCYRNNKSDQPVDKCIPVVPTCCSYFDLLFRLVVPILLLRTTRHFRNNRSEHPSGTTGGWEQTVRNKVTEEQPSVVPTSSG